MSHVYVKIEAWSVSTYCQTPDVKNHGMLIAMMAEQWTAWAGAEPGAIARYLMQLARYIQPRRISTSKRGLIPTCVR